MLFRLTSPFLALLDGLEHRHHVGYALVTPKLLVGLLSIGGLSRTCAEGLTFLIIATTVACVMCLVGAAVSLAMLAKLLGMRLLRDSIR